MPDRIDTSTANPNYTRKLADGESIVKGKGVNAGGTRPTNDASMENPFNTMPPEGYDYWKQANSQFLGQFKPQKGDGKIGGGNRTSNDNPLAVEPQDLNVYKYGERQPKFLPPRRNDDGRDRQNMEGETRDYLSNVYGVDFQNNKLPSNYNDHN